MSSPSPPPGLGTSRNSARSFRSDASGSRKSLTDGNLAQVLEGVVPLRQFLPIAISGTRTVIQRDREGSSNRHAVGGVHRDGRGTVEGLTFALPGEGFLRRGKTASRRCAVRIIQLDLPDVSFFACVVDHANEVRFFIGRRGIEGRSVGKPCLLYHI